MKLAHVLIAVVVSAAVVAIAFSQPAQEANANAQLAGRLDALNDTLLRVSDSLDLAVTQQRVNLLLKRVELAQYRLQPDQAKLNRLQADRRSARESLEQLKMFRQQVVEEAEAVGQSGDPGDADSRRRLVREVEQRIEENEEQLQKANDEIQQTEFDMQQRRQAIDDLDSQLLDLIDSLDQR